MDNGILNRLMLLGQLNGHRGDYMKDNSADLMNSINKISVKIIFNDEIQVRYNHFDTTLIVTLTSETIYDFFEELLRREDAYKIDINPNEPILIEKWKDELKDWILKIHLDKNFDRYLKHEKLESVRFEIEYYDGIIIFRDKNKELTTNVVTLKDAVQQCV